MRRILREPLGTAIHRLPDLRVDLLCSTATLALDGETGEELTAAARTRLDERANEDAA